MEQPQLFNDNLEYRFNGPCYDPAFDQDRLTGQIKRVYACMIDGQWRTLDEIHQATRDPHASISAQLRNLRKERFGKHIVDKRSRGDRKSGLWEYRLTRRPTIPGGLRWRKGEDVGA